MLGDTSDGGSGGRGERDLLALPGHSAVTVLDEYPVELAVTVLDEYPVVLAVTVLAMVAGAGADTGAIVTDSHILIHSVSELSENNPLSHFLTILIRCSLSFMTSLLRCC